MNRRGRTLRSPRLRALIWRSQNGICALCNQPMRPDEDWEIDHADPWRITHRTNLFELQATHKKCNRKAGGKLEFEIRHWNRLREGQKRAINMIEQRVRRREETTAIVAPCRYGKSDIMRLVAVKLWAEGLACTSLAISPGTNLRDQLGSPLKWSKSLKRYGVTSKRGSPAINTIDKPKAGVRARFNPNNEAFLSATIQLVQINLDLFADWVSDEVRRTGLPAVVFIDECHNSSDDNEWGQIVPALTEAGAHVVLLTATPERADEKPIPGFKFDVSDEKDITIWRSQPHHTDPELITVERYEGQECKLTLVPDVSVGFREAWAEPDEGQATILCKISRVGFDAELTIDREPIRLSELTVSDTKKHLGKIVRHPVCIAYGAKKLIDGLLARRELNPGFQAIVYCGNDIGVGYPDEHPQDIWQAIDAECDERGIKRFDVKVATSANDGAETLRRFAGTEDDPGEGDVLIVKQMAGMGLDLPWVKVGLDLSPTRTYPMFIQRLFRPATPCGGAVACEWITPDDPISAAYFKRAVEDQGGEAHATDLSLVESYDKKRKDAADSVQLVIDGVQVGSFEDSHGHAAQPEQWELVAEVLSKMPRITSVYTHAEIAEIADVLLRGDTTTESADNAPIIDVRDTATQAQALRDEINRAAHDATRQSITARGLWPAARRDKSIYSNTIERIYSQAKKAADWPLGLNGESVELKACDDLDALYRFKVAVETLRDQQ